MRRGVSLACLVVVWTCARGAQAWSDAELCVTDESTQLLYTPAQPGPEPGEARNLCLPDSEPGDTAGLGGRARVEGPTIVDDAAEGRTRVRRAQVLAKAGQREDALLQLRVVERDLPRVADRFALQRADLLVALGMPEQACDAYAIAAQSVNREIAIRAQIGSVRCSLRAGNRKGERALQALLTRYPRLPQRHQLELELAAARERAGSLRGAAEVLRRIDLADPASSVAERAREALARLAGQGVRVAPYSAKERVQRTERLLFDGPLEQAAAEVSTLQNDRSLGAELHAQVAQLSARIARIQGRFDQASADAKRTHKSEAQQAGQASSTDPATAEREAVERRIRTLSGGRPVARLRNGPLRSVLELAIAHGMKELCDAVLDEMPSRRQLDAVVRFDAALRASGLASDDKVAALLETLLEVPRYRLSARYHYARALERLGRSPEAEAQYLRVIAADRGPMPYYAMWSGLRLWTMRSQTRESCLPHEAARVAQNDDRDAAALPTTDARAAGREPIAAPVTANADSEPLDTGALAALAEQTPLVSLPDAGPPEALSPALSLVGAIFDTGSPASLQHSRLLAPATDTLPAAADRERIDSLSDPGMSASIATFGRAPAVAPRPDTDPATRRQQVLALLAPIAARHGEAYPWLLRAQDLVELELFQDAADEINEAFLAYRDASGALRLRSGLLSLLTGNAPPRRPVTFALGKARRALDRETRMVLSEIANLLGDPGVGVRFGKERLNDRPRAYAELVERAAHKHGLDPNLLFAVMRVESIYNRRIISSAGAVGLMQIMPATGERIAQKLGVGDFDATELLDPQVNLDFSAWYLASLLERFDGRLPLAIASYNGGPHNVRLWLRENPPHMPLDAFLERIPFSQTHEYVRRVLAFYAQYRAQQNLPMTRLSVELPRLRPDLMAF